MILDEDFDRNRRRLLNPWTFRVLAESASASVALLVREIHGSFSRKQAMEKEPRR